MSRRDTAGAAKKMKDMLVIAVSAPTVSRACSEISARRRSTLRY